MLIAPAALEVELKKLLELEKSIAYFANDTELKLTEKELYDIVYKDDIHKKPFEDL